MVLSGWMRILSKGVFYSTNAVVLQNIPFFHTAVRSGLEAVNDKTWRLSGSSNHYCYHSGQLEIHLDGPPTRVLLEKRLRQLPAVFRLIGSTGGLFPAYTSMASLGFRYC